MLPLNYVDQDTCLMHLIRHGATPPNLESPPIMQGRGINPPLAEIGQAQSRKAGEALASRPLAAVYSSPLARARGTAEAVASPHGLTVGEQQDLTEVQMGRWEGLSWDEIQRDEPERYRKFTEDPVEHGYPEGENLAEVAQRIIPCFERILASHLGQEIAVVAHSVVNRVYLGQLLGMSLADGRRVAQENCAISLVRYHNGRAKALTINAVAHLMAT